MAEELQLTLLGNPEVRQDGVLLTDLRSRKAMALLCYLAVTGRPHLRPILVGLLWGEMPEALAQNNLSKALTHLRQVVGPHLHITRQEVAFDRERPYWLDVEVFEQGASALADIEGLQRAVELYRGDFLEGFYVDQSPAFEEWVLVQRARMRELALQALRTLAVHHTHRGPAGNARAMEYTTRLLALDPWREEAYRQLMLLLARSGQRGAALAHYEACRDVLVRELGVEPGAQTTRLYEQIRDGELEIPPVAPVLTGQPEPLPQRPSFLDEGAEDVEPPVFVARERELARLDALLESALQAQGQVVFVTGGPGRGKTALLSEFARRAMASHPELLVASGSCSAYAGAGDPYLSFREVMGMLTGEVEPLWSAGAISRDHALRLWRALPVAAEALLAHGPHVMPALVLGGALLARVEMAYPTAPWLTRLREQVERGRVGSDRLEQSHLFQQVGNVLHALAEVHPLLLILDDLQWIDRTSAGLLFHLGRRLEGSCILIAGAYRPEEVSLGVEDTSSAERERHLQVQEDHPLEKVLAEFKLTFGDVWLDLAEVEEPEGRHFVDAFLGTEPNRLREGFRQALTERAGGHPLFTIELLRAMQERGDLVQDEAGCWVEGPALDWEVLPARVEGVIEERIERLGEDLREILTVASVEGEDFTAEVVAEVRAMEARELVRCLSGELQRKHRLVRARGLRQLEAQRLGHYRFQHHLFQKYLYNHLDEAERVYLHRDVGTVLEALYDGQTDEVAVQLARHFQEAGYARKAIDYWKQAGDAAAGVYANEEAIVHYSRALELLPEDDLAMRCALLLDRVRIHNLLGNRGAQSEDLDVLQTLAEGLGDARKQVEVALGKAAYAEAMGDYPSAIAAAEQVIALTGKVGDHEGAVRGHLAWGQTLRRLGTYDPAREHLREALNLASEADLPDCAAESLSALGLIEYDLGNQGAAQDFLEQALVVFRRVGNLTRVGDVLNSLGTVLNRVGDYAAARVYFEQAAEIFAEIGHRLGEGVVQFNLGHAAGCQGVYSEAGRYYESCLAIFEQTENRLGQGAVLNNLGEIAHYQGDYSGARDHYEQALATFREVGNRSFEGYALTGLGDALAELGDLDGAATAYRQAVALRRELGQHAVEMESQAGLAQVELGQGNLGQAQRHVTTILQHLDAGGGLESPCRVYLACYQVLKASQDPRAKESLETAYHLLQEQAAKIPDEEVRRSFLQDIPLHQQIISSRPLRQDEGAGPCP